MAPKVKIGLVGPCAAGKSTLAAGLKNAGYDAKPIAQEHSYVGDMWQLLTAPDILVYLDVSYPVSQERRRLNWKEGEFSEQVHRLSHARQHADYYLHTDSLSIEEVLHKVLAFLEAAA